MADYHAPTRDLMFMLTEVLDAAHIRGLPDCDDYEPDTISAIVDEAGRFASSVLAPLNASGDVEGVHAAAVDCAAWYRWIEGTGGPPITMTLASGRRSLIQAACTS